MIPVDPLLIATLPAELPPDGTATAVEKPDASITVALFEIGSHLVAFPIGLVSAAITRPRSLASAPESCTAFLGTFEHAGQCYPLVDLRITLGYPVAPIEDVGHAVLLKLGDKMTAIVIDRVEGIKSLRLDAIVPLHVVSGATITPVAHVEGYERPVTVLMEADLLALKGLAFGEATPAMRGRGEIANSSPGCGAKSCLSVTRQGIMYAIDVSYIVEIVTTPAVVTMALPQPGALGRIAARGKDVLLLDRLAPEERSVPRAAAPNCALVLDVEGLRFAVPVDVVHTLSKLSTSASLPGTRQTGSAAVGLAEAPSGRTPQVVLNPAALLTMPETRAIIAYYNQQTREEGIKPMSSAHHSFLELETEGRFYVPLTDIREIATFHRSVVVHAEDSHTADGYVHHRGNAIAIIDLAARWKSGHPSSESLKTVVVQDSASNDYVGFVVDRVTSIEQFEIVEIPQSGAESAAVIRAAGNNYRKFWRLVEARGRDKSRIVSIFDILDLTRNVLAPGH
ncbi:chemotaxis protein CheW [uncultured Jannaschia sp.]|uniref:chemotaxis protein CheW n=1 Tax=uncultured Jannaschia sp. TaxID=293347 RepID=UPI0026301AAB|nr:chemotaxis protein CheW [uncultured Jannaschia sp.]